MTDKSLPRPVHGGPAFPFYAGEESFGPGMSLRDYFAAKALVALASLDEGFNPVRDADVCYEVADAMLKARGGAA